MPTKQLLYTICHNNYKQYIQTAIHQSTISTVSTYNAIYKKQNEHQKVIHRAKQ